MRAVFYGLVWRHSHRGLFLSSFFMLCLAYHLGVRKEYRIPTVGAEIKAVGAEKGG